MEKNKNIVPENPNVTVWDTEKEIYKSEDDKKYFTEQIQRINNEYVIREQPSAVFNGMPYSVSYLNNQRSAINYTPPASEEDRQVNTGLIHEKVMALIAIFLKYKYNREIKCIDREGRPVDGLGEVYNLAIEFSNRIEKQLRKNFLIFWELFTQGDCFVEENWEVKTKKEQLIYKRNEDGSKGPQVKPEDMEYTYEAMENYVYEDGEKIQSRKAVSNVLDGRRIIFSNPEVEDLQEMPQITLEEEMDLADAEKLYGTLSMWKKVPKTREQVTALYSDVITLFDANRLKKPESRCIVHKRLDKQNGRFNISINGVFVLPRTTPFTVYQPSGNYNIAHFCSERMTGSIYSRSQPAKLKFNADYANWVLKKLALKFEQGIEPPMLVKGKYTLTRDIFKGGQFTHGITRDNYEKADPDNKGITNADMSMYEIVKGIQESQSLSATASGELEANATATEISITDQNQRDKLAVLIDGIIWGFADLAERRIETLQWKYTIPKDTTTVDGKEIPIYDTLHIDIEGTMNNVEFYDNMADPFQNFDKRKNDLYKKAHQDGKAGRKTVYFDINPQLFRSNDYIKMVSIKPERVKELNVQLNEMLAEFSGLMKIFGPTVNVEEMQKMYTEKSGRPTGLFTPPALANAEQGLPQDTPEAGDLNASSKPKPMAQPKAL